MQQQKTNIIPIRSDVGGQISHVQSSGQREYYQESWDNSASTKDADDHLSGFKFVVSAISLVVVICGGMLAIAINQKPAFDNQQLQANLAETQAELTRLQTCLAGSH